MGKQAGSITGLWCHEADRVDGTRAALRPLVQRLVRTVLCWLVMLQKASPMVERLELLDLRLLPIHLDRLPSTIRLQLPRQQVCHCWEQCVRAADSCQPQR